MTISRNTKILAAALLALGLAACTTKKPAATDNSAAAGQQASPYGAAGAETSAAGSGGGLDSQALGGADGQAAGANGAASLLGIKVVHFDYDSADIAPDDFNALKAHALYLSKTPNARVQLGGHTDERGTREYNMALGERRAKAVAAFLTSNGVNPGQLEIVSYGEEKPLATGESESAWAENRRVELEYTAARP